MASGVGPLTIIVVVIPHLAWLIMSIYQGREQLALIWVGVGIWKVALVVDNSGGSGRLVDGDGGKKEPMIQLWLNCAARFGHPQATVQGSHSPCKQRGRSVYDSDILKDWV